MVSYDTFVAEVPLSILKYKKFCEWFEKLDLTEQTKIELTVETIANEGIITSAKSLNEGLYEKKYHSGLRLYFAIIEEEQDLKKTLLIYGSKKGRDQETSIRKARLIVQKYKVFLGNIIKK